MAGNYVTGLMTYVRINNDYSRFELDNIQRYLTWEYLDVSNFIVAQIAGSPRSGSVAAALTQADAQAAPRWPPIRATTTRQPSNERAPPTMDSLRRPPRSTCPSRPQPTRRQRRNSRIDCCARCVLLCDKRSPFPHVRPLGNETP